MNSILDFLQAQPPAIWMAALALLLSIVNFIWNLSHSIDQKKLIAAQVKTDLISSLLACESALSSAIRNNDDFEPHCDEMKKCWDETINKIEHWQTDIEQEIEIVSGGTQPLAASKIEDLRGKALVVQSSFENLQKTMSQYVTFCNTKKDKGLCPDNCDMFDEDDVNDSNEATAIEANRTN